MSYSKFSGQDISQEVRYFNKFIKSESAGGVILLICAIIAIIIANVPALAPLQRIWNIEAGLELGNFSLKMTLYEWVNDCLMAVFFFVVGLEIKREMMVGQLSSFKKATLPVFAALGGMIFPALIYAACNINSPETMNGWGIPMATDIAFAIGILSLLGNRVPIGIKVLLTALAIADDLGAIIVLAVFYPTHALCISALLIALGIFIFLLIMNRIGVKSLVIYIIGGLFMWYFVLSSGIHATIAGVLLALAIPHKTKFNGKKLARELTVSLHQLEKETELEGDVFASKDQQYLIHRMSEHLDMTEPLMHKCETKLSPIVNFIIMPLFALANAGVAFGGNLFGGGLSPVSIGIFFGLIVGKPLGITIFSLIAVKSRLSDLPQGVNFKQIFAMGVLGGIGFTMSIFIDNLAFPNSPYLEIGKATILLTSFTAALLGLVTLYIMTRQKTTK